ncbi:DUF58 domain-containing protein [Luteolibacter yonseiensis]|uniref:DUF58 domain-containing protein n=1 Tax=Luteolibacter yonseiensis TaxID=1144680 RepID=A0A934R0M6_9BACT|nr:DUF58 domain-containing protein [Luteolibacter yonseiensis]MBK1814156.1 DUF58 domain-containing protein [Luteolibacter yonseiensis]
MTPTSRLLLLSSLWLLLAAVASALPVLTGPWLWLGVAGAAVVLVDGGLAWLRKPLEIRRRLPGRFALGEAGEVRITLRNDSRSAAKLEIHDGIPQKSAAPSLPWTGVVPANREIRVFYPVTLTERGMVVFTRLHARRFSPLGFWTRRSLHLADEPVKVYPNYEPVIRFALLAMKHRENPMGIVRRPRAGSSRDFHQLRDYRDGDPLGQIDWKASSRRQMLISRDYQEQRNQSVVFLLDTGRRMRAMDGDLPQFDHVLNAILLVAHVALKQGDHVAVKSFGGSDRWLAPVKGAHAMPVLLNHLYDYQTTAAPSDFAGAVEKLMARQRRRSLVILLTNLRGEDGKELVPALQVLKSKHLVMLASMRERVVEDIAATPVESFSSALQFLATDRYMQERREILATLGSLGVLTLDSTAQELAVALANSYFDIKAAGRI